MKNRVALLLSTLVLSMMTAPPAQAVAMKCPKQNVEAESLIALAKKEIMNPKMSPLLQLEIEPGALSKTREAQLRTALAAAVRYTDQSVPIKYLVPKTKAWFLKRWPEDSNYIAELGNEAAPEFGEHSLGSRPRYAVSGKTREIPGVWLIQSISIILKPTAADGSLHWYGHSFGAPFGAALAQALGMLCYGDYRQEVVSLAKQFGPNLQDNESWSISNIDLGWRQGFLVNEYLTGKYGIARAGGMNAGQAGDANFDSGLLSLTGLSRSSFYALMAKRLSADFAKS